MNRRKVLATLASVAVIAGGMAQPTSAGASSACMDLGGAVDANQVCRVHTVGAGYEVTFTFPVDYPDQQKLSTFLTQRRQDFIGYAANDFPRGRRYQLDARADAYHSGTATSGTKSLVFEEYGDSGGAHPSNSYAAFNYDLSRGAPITFDMLFKPGANPVQALDAIVGPELQKRFEGRQERYEGHGGDVSPIPPNSLGAKMYQNFAITDDAVIFFIGQGQWLSQIDGLQEVSVSRTELAPLLARA